MNKNIPYYLVSVGIFVVLKLVYSAADTEDMIFLLAPINWIIELSFGSSSLFNPDTGYIHPQLQIIIDKSCSGFNFLLLCFIMLTTLGLKHFTSTNNKLFILPVAIILSYFLTILVNSSRIVASIIISANTNNFLPQKPLHEIVGIITNLTFLVLIYFISEKTMNNLKTNAQSA